MAQTKNANEDEAVANLSFIQAAFQDAEGEQQTRSLSRVRFETVVRAGVEEQKDIHDLIDEVKDRKPDLSIKPTEKDMSRLLLIAESCARLFVCCEITVAEDLRERINTLPTALESRSLIVRLSRAANFLQLANFGQGPLLSEGGFGRVYLTKSRFSGKLYALKQVRIHVPDKTDKKEIFNFMKHHIFVFRERDAMLMIDHPFICKLKASWVEKTETKSLAYLFLMEYAPYGDLHNFIYKVFYKMFPADVYGYDDPTLLQIDEENRRNEGGANLPSDPAVRKKLIYIYATEMACAVHYLHTLKIVHRDFKPKNVLIGEDFHIRVTDFGIVNPRRAYHSFSFHHLTTERRSRLLSMTNSEDMKPRPDGKQYGTLAYNATPELISGKVQDSNTLYPMDNWSLGLVLCELYCGIHPFKAEVSPNDDFESAMKEKILNHKTCRFLNEPLYSKIIDDQDFRNVVSGLVCDIDTRFSSTRTLRILKEMLVKLTGLSLEEHSKSSLDFMRTVVKRTQPINLDCFDDFEVGKFSPYSPQGLPAVMKTFPYCSNSPSIS